MNTALSIAGGEPSGGAGIQAYIEAITMKGACAMSAIRANPAKGLGPNTLMRTVG